MFDILAISTNILRAYINLVQYQGNAGKEIITHIKSMIVFYRSR